MFSVVWPKAVGIHHLKYQNTPSLSDWFTAGFATHAYAHWHLHTQPNTAVSVFFLHFLPSLPTIPAFPFLLLSPCFSTLIYFFFFYLSLHFLHLPINSYFKLFLYLTLFSFTLPCLHFFLWLTHSPFLFPFMTLCFPLFCIFLSLYPALSLSPSSFDGLVVGGTDSARLELLSQCEMCCCGDDMSHFTLDWWCVWGSERELECRE